MHELSIADAILDLAQRHVPDGCALSSVHVVAGPMRAIDSDAMQLAWQAVLESARIGDPRLELELAPWTLRCPHCHRQWQSADLESPCTCGCDRPSPAGGDELQITSILVDDVALGATP